MLRLKQTLKHMPRNAINMLRFSTRIKNDDYKNSSILSSTTANSMKEVMINDITNARVESASAVVNWFLEHMPKSYFKQVPDDIRRQHLKAIAAIQDLNQKDLTLKLFTPHASGNGIEVTYITSGCGEGLLFSQIHGLEIPADHYLTNVKVFSSLDEKVSLNIFTFGRQVNFATGTEASIPSIMKFIEEIKVTKHDDYMKNKLSLPSYSDIYSKSNMNEYFKVIPHSYLSSVRDYRRFLIVRSLYNEVKGTEDVAVHIDAFTDPATQETGSWISVATPNILPEKMLQIISHFLKFKNFKIHRAHLDNFLNPDNKIECGSTGYVTMLRLLVSPDPSVTYDEAELGKFIKDLKRLKWIDDDVIDMGIRYPTLGLDKAEIIVALCSMLHGPLSKQNNQEYASIKNVISILDKSPHFIKLANEMAQLFLDRFNPAVALNNEKFEARIKAIDSNIKQLHLEGARLLLLKMLEAVKSTLRTNFFNENRYGLALRIHPSIMINANSPAQPYGVFFVNGRNFNAFHCRFRDIARGGIHIHNNQYYLYTLYTNINY